MSCPRGANGVENIRICTGAPDYEHFCQMQSGWIHRQSIFHGATGEPTCAERIHQCDVWTAKVDPRDIHSILYQIEANGTRNCNAAASILIFICAGENRGYVVPNMITGVRKIDLSSSHLHCPQAVLFLASSSWPFNYRQLTHMLYVVPTNCVSRITYETTAYRHRTPPIWKIAPSVARYVMGMSSAE
ncbi:hypothetical protein FQZ97_1029240 [compost metagenome]